MKTAPTAELDSGAFALNLARKLRPGEHENVVTAAQERIISSMMQAHAVGQDICLVGPAASGKTFAIQRFADILGYEVETVHLYRDMTARDLLQRRGTKLDGSSYWQNTPLVDAALKGRMAVLDGVHWLAPGTLATLQRLIEDREVTLPDGSVLKSPADFDILKAKLAVSEEKLWEKGIYRIHPSFRVIVTAVASPESESSRSWLTEEVANMFHFVKVDEINSEDAQRMISESSQNGQTPHIQVLLEFASNLRRLLASNSKLSNLIPLTTRQLIRLSNRIAITGSISMLESDLKRFCLYPFLPSYAKKTFQQLLVDAGLSAALSASASEELYVKRLDSFVDFSGFNVPYFSIAEGDAESKALIPSSETSGEGFFENPLHLRVLKDMAIDFAMGDHLLLIGNQGVGKNKLTDRLLELLGRPREYIQLHRETTISALTLSASVENGTITYSDSPLVRAIRTGRVIVIDEADKAPVSITAALKSLADTGEMNLADGRRVRPYKSTDDPGSVETIQMHPDFRMIVLANRPGYPFLGNDFFATIGDVFSVHPIENPDPESEFQLVRQMAPDIDAKLLRRFVAVFGDLRMAFDDNLVNYPYSLRELINLARHMQKFPNDPLEEVLRNVFDFDFNRPDSLKLIADAFRRNGLAIVFRGKVNAPRIAVPYISYNAENEEEVKRDPLRLSVEPPSRPPPDTPNMERLTLKTNHTLEETNGQAAQAEATLQEEKKKVPAHVLERARALGKRALETRLKEIKMSNFDSKVYAEFYTRVRADILRMKTMLEGIGSLKSERAWLRHKSEGDFDDSKLVESILGEKSVFKQRGEREPDMSQEKEKPKRLKFVFDVSGSMYRFNDDDGRLSRSLETALLVMESLQGLESKYVYDIVGHSGDSDCIEFVKANDPPKDEMERLKVLQNMEAHTQYCSNGDSTLPATKRAMKDILENPKMEADSYFVVVISDANLTRYGITASQLAEALVSEKSVQSAMIFIGSLQGQAEVLSKRMPKGKAWIASSSTEIPAIIKELLSAFTKS
ncbi:hypothetical protein HDU96_005449 [Phlyctochytrium bullatum]|nr:hypothetical protein HDU96_005449 [Phlyctochytrium bullatum]